MLFINISQGSVYLDNYKQRFTKLQNEKEFRAFIGNAL